jgi:hypothetical protein
VSVFRRIGGSDDGSERIAGLAGPEQIRQVARTTTLGVGTLACPACDAPVSPGPHRLAPGASLACPFCGHAAAVRDFLTLGAPTRPAHVVIKVTTPTGLRIEQAPAD